jgi:hypothetical protein
VATAPKRYSSFFVTGCNILPPTIFFVLAHGARVSYHLAPDWRDASKVMATDVEIVR